MKRHLLKPTYEPKTWCGLIKRRGSKFTVLPPDSDIKDVDCKQCIWRSTGKNIFGVKENRNVR